MCSLTSCPTVISFSKKSNRVVRLMDAIATVITYRDAMMVIVIAALVT